MTGLTVENRAMAAFLGFAIGDALGATVEFMTKGEIAAQYGVHREIVGGGWLRLKPGQVTDDTQMALALGRSIIRRGEPRYKGCVRRICGMAENRAGRRGQYLPPRHPALHRAWHRRRLVLGWRRREWSRHACSAIGAGDLR